MSSKMQIYKVSLDKTAKLMTAFFFAIIVFVLGLNYALGGFEGRAGLIAGVSLVAILALSTVWCYWLSLVAVVIDGGNALVIKRRIGKKTIKLSEVVSAERYGDFGSDLRICGVGGVFGFTGWFRNKSLGNYFAYVGDTKSTVLVVTKKRKYVVSCDSPDELAEALRQAIGRA